MEMSFGAVVAVAGCEAFLAIVVEASRDARCDEDNLAVRLVLVVTDGATDIKIPNHNLVLSVKKYLRYGVAIAALELRHDVLLYFLEVYNHGFSFLQK